MAVCAGITYNAGNNRINIHYNASDGSKGASYNNPYTLQDVYDTDIANGWGKIVQIAINDYNIYNSSAELYFGGDDTYFNAWNCGLTFNGMASGAYCMRNINSPHIKFGVEKNTTTPQPFHLFHSDNNVFYYYIRLNYAVVEFHYSTIDGLRVHTLQGIEGEPVILKDCLIKSYSTFDVGGDQEVENCIFITGYITYNRNAVKFYNNYIGKDAEFYSNFLADEATVEKLTLHEDSYYRALLVNGMDKVLRLVDSPVADIATVASILYPESEYTYKYITTFNAIIENASGGELTIKDKDGNVVYSETLSSDSMAEQELTFNEFGFYSPPESGSVVETETVFHPFTLKVTKAGYQDLEIPGITVTAGVPTTIYGAMETVTYVNANISGSVAAQGVSGAIAVKEIGGTVNI